MILRKKESPKISKKDLGRITFIKDMLHEGVEQQLAKKKTTLPQDWKAMRNRIKKSDGHQCVICGERRWLTVHHRDGNQQNVAPENTITICRICHDKIPVPPFSDDYYCKIYIHEWGFKYDEEAGEDIETYKPVCCRLGVRAGYRDSRTCEFFSKNRGCLYEAWKNITFIEERVA